MCLPLRFLKCIVGFSAWITILTGVTSFIVGIVVSIKTSGDGNSYYEAIGDGAKSSLVICLYIFGGCLFVIGLFGVIGGSKKNACCLTIYNFGAILSFVVFIIVGAVAYGVTSVFSNTSESDCMTKDWSAPIYQLSSNAQSLFCKSDPSGNGCQCYIDPAVFPDPTIYGITDYTNTAGSPVSFDQCAQFKTLPSNVQDQSNLLDAAEKQFHCAGWCTQSPIYLFSDVNNGKPDISCFDDVSNWLHDNGLIIGDICMAIAGVLLLIIIFTCCLCFHPEKKMQAGNFYQRMAYYDQ